MNLNIYKVSGVAKVGYNDRVKYWLAGTNDLANTRAVNYVLSELNLCNTTLSYTEDKEERVDLMNLIDLYTIVLEGLFAVQQSEVYSIETIGQVISNMVVNDLYNSTSDDITVRTNNLDALITKFENLLVNIPENIETDADFDLWWDNVIVDNNYNDTPQNVLKNYENIAKVGSDDEEVTLAQKTSDAGPTFLYLFMTDEQLARCNKKIKKRYNIEVQKWKWETKICRGAYEAQAIYNMYKNGCTLYYGMTPEKKIQELIEYNNNKKRNKVGEPATAIISAVVALVGLIISLIYFVLDIYKITYEYDEDYEDGVPDQSADGWDFGDALNSDGNLTGNNSTTTKSSNTMLYIGIAVAAFLFLQ